MVAAASHHRTIVPRVRTSFNNVQVCDIAAVSGPSLSSPLMLDNPTTWGGVLFHLFGADSAADLLIQDPVTNNVIYKGTVTTYYSQFSVAVIPALPANLPATAPVFVGRLTTYNRLSSIDIYNQQFAAHTNPAIEVGVAPTSPRWGSGQALYNQSGQLPRSADDRRSGLGAVIIG
jgi:hypothetical protein